MKRFERSNVLDTALYKNYLYLFFYSLLDATITGFWSIGATVLPLDIVVVSSHVICHVISWGSIVEPAFIINSNDQVEGFDCNIFMLISRKT